MYILWVVMPTENVVTDIFHAILHRLQVVIPILQFVLGKAIRCTFRGCYIEFNVVKNTNQVVMCHRRIVLIKCKSLCIVYMWFI